MIGNVNLHQVTSTELPVAFPINESRLAVVGLCNFSQSSLEESRWFADPRDLQDTVGRASQHFIYSRILGHEVGRQVWGTHSGPPSRGKHSGLLHFLSLQVYIKYLHRRAVIPNIYINAKTWFTKLQLAVEAYNMWIHQIAVQVEYICMLYIYIPYSVPISTVSIQHYTYQMSDTASAV